MSIQLKDVNFIYSPDTVYETKALRDINLTITAGESVGIIGHTGSGKSTFMQLLNGLLKPTTGDVIINSVNTKDNKTDVITLRKDVGLVFQYPEYQLFEETVYKDVEFGPKNLGLSEEEAKLRVEEAIKLVGLDYEKLKDRSPFDLSGGQKRKVAIAGVLAMKPSILLLDEPTAGLDPHAKEELIELLKKIKEEWNITVIFISHSMEDVTNLADRVVVFSEGEIVLDDEKNKVFSNVKLLERVGLDVPQVSKITSELMNNGWDINDDSLISIDDLSKVIVRRIQC